MTVTAFTALTSVSTQTSEHFPSVKVEYLVLLHGVLRDYHP